MPTNHHADRRFNPGERTLRQHTGHAHVDIMTRLLWTIEGNPACTDLCEHRLLNVVTHHLKSRGLRSLQAAAGVVRALSELYNAFLMAKGERVQRVEPSGPQATLGASSPQPCLAASNTSNVAKFHAKFKVHISN